MGVSVLKTRLYKPITDGTHIRREKLIKKLEQGQSKVLTLVIAPTGFGKSVLVSQWLESDSKQFSWLTIDNDLNDFLSLLTYLVYVVKQNFKDSLKSFDNLLDEDFIPSEDILIDLFINELDEIDEEFIIVLDDYQKLKDPNANKLISRILQYPPENLHMVILSRWDPTLNLSSQRAYGLLNDIRAEDLIFDVEETKLLARKTAQRELSDDVCEVLIDKTEGWLIGIYLAIKYMIDDEVDAEKISKMPLDQKYFREYLMYQIMEGFSEEEKAIFSIAVISDSFSKDMVEFLMDDLREDLKFDSEVYDNFLNKILLAIPLDDEKKKFRFHQLIYTYVRERLERVFKDELVELNRRASVYYQREGSYEKAIKHAIESGDIDLIVEVFRTNGCTLLNNDQLNKLSKWLDLIPGEIIESRLELLLQRTVLHENSNDFDAMLLDLKQAERLLLDLDEDDLSSQQYWGEYYAGWSCYLYMKGDNAQAMENAKKSLRLLRPYPGYIRDFALFYYVVCLQAIGQRDKAQKYVDQNLSEITNSEFRKRLRVLLAKIHITAHEADLNQQIALSRKYRSICQKHNIHSSQGYAYHFLLGGYFSQNQLDKVDKLLPEFDKLIYLMRPFWALNSLFIKGLSKIALGDMVGFHDTMGQIYRLSESWSSLNMNPIIKAYEVEVELLQGNYKKAQSKSLEANFEPYIPFKFFYFPQITKARLLMYSGEEEKLQEAERLLQDMVEYGRSNHLMIFLAKTLPLQAVLYYMTGNVDAALRSLDESLSISRDQGFIRNYLDLGKMMHSMIKSLLNKRPTDELLISIDQAFNPEQEVYHQFEAVNMDEPRVDPEIRLSKRETEILELLAKGYQNKEIATDLFISNEAVKKSLYRLYQKLDVNNRSSAIMHAVNMGLVSGPSL